MSQLTLRQASRMSFIWLSFAALNVWIWEIPICVWCLYGYNLIDRYISIFSLGQTKQQPLRNFGSTLENCLVPVTRPDNFCSVKRLKDVNASTSFVRYRTISGICNNLTPGKATVGAAGTITGRFFERKWSTFYLVVASIYSIDIWSRWFNSRVLICPFYSNFPFLQPLKMSENKNFRLGEYRKRKIAMKWVKCLYSFQASIILHCTKNEVFH